MKPRISKVGGMWRVRALDYRGTPHDFVGITVREAWHMYEDVMQRLRRLGMLWEIFP